MNQYFDASSQSWVVRDEAQQVRSLTHVKPLAWEEPSAHFTDPTQLAKLAVAYFVSVAPIYGSHADEFVNALQPGDGPLLPTGAAVRYKVAAVKTTMDIATVELQQTWHGIPVWRAGAAAQLQAGRALVLGSQFTGLRFFQLEPYDLENLKWLLQIQPGQLASLLELSVVQARLQGGNLLPPKISQRRPWIYRYSRAFRPRSESPNESAKAVAKRPTLPVSEVSDEVQDGRDYLVVQVLFALRIDGWGQLNWSALVETRTNSVLLLEPLVDSVNALVFPDDPVTLCRCANIGPASPAAQLDPLRQSVVLQGLNVPDGAGQALEGEYVRLVDCYAPVVACPTQAVGSDFLFSSRTNEFAAVSAYYHCDAFFRLLEEMGFDVRTYFDGTTFPIPVDHRASADIDGIFGGVSDNNGNQVNAQSLGNVNGNGQGALIFLLADTLDLGNPLGAAADRRVVLHELGHSLLWDHVSSPNFGFAHSAGDSLAAILGDVAGPALDPGQTIPFTHQALTPLQQRRHDRPVLGWAWGGVNDDAGYFSEQILSTTLFRLYQSIGGAHPDLDRRRFAARFCVYLIVRAIATLTPSTNAPHAIDFANALMLADAGEWAAQSQAGGAYHKVIRWAFEKQGLYQGAFGFPPYITAGAAPDVDVYIDNGRAGEYAFIADNADSVGIWNRTANDGGSTHQAATPAQPNFVHVRIVNRGAQLATNVRVRGFQCVAAAENVFPADWTQLTTAELTAAPLASGASQVLGPFQWTPLAVGDHRLLFSVSADGDPSNIDARVVGPIPNWRLIPHDNNLGQRLVTVQPIVQPPAGPPGSS